MLQPRTYPELLGKALVLEAEPFATMADDDNPWVEGLFFVVCLGVIVGLAQFVGGILLTASLPPAETLRETAMILLRQLFAWSSTPALDLESSEAWMRQGWQWLTFASGYGGGWARLILMIFVPAGLMTTWLAYGAISHVAARRLGGIGTLNQTLGVTALTVAPQALLILTLIPFVSVAWPLLAVWALLIAFRGLEVAHDLSWQRSVLAALAAPALLAVLAIGTLMIMSFSIMIGGIA
ncbi:MAG: YIP1 family protein [Litorilinea sp.]